MESLLARDVMRSDQCIRSWLWLKTQAQLAERHSPISILQDLNSIRPVEQGVAQSQYIPSRTCCGALFKLASISSSAW